MGTFFGDPHNKDYSILGSILGSPYFGKLPFGNPMGVYGAVYYRVEGLRCRDCRV